MNSTLATILPKSGAHSSQYDKAKQKLRRYSLSRLLCCCPNLEAD